MKRLAFLAGWTNRNLLLICSLVLLVVIPLYPKIPLFDILPGYIVKVRIEDFLILFTGLVWLRDVIRKKIVWNTCYFWLACLYACAGLFSIVLGIVLTQTVPFQLLHIGKTSLNFFRYLEYFSIFFFLYSSIQKRRNIIVAIMLIAVTVLGIVGYGLGQKYAHFPVYSTMNREYSKGEKLYLQPGTRPQSTFAGPYDLSAYLVIVLPLLFSISLGGFATRSRDLRLLTFAVLQLVHAAGFAMLVLSGSKTSLLGYLIGMLLVVVIHISRLPTRKQQVTVSGFVLVLGIVGILLGWIVAPTSIKNKVIQMVHKDSKVQDRPSDLVGTGYQPKTVSEVQPDGTTKYWTVQEKSVWSANALKYGLSMGIRLDTLWPQALLGFSRNPLTGSSYGTLATLDSHGFTEADSTDNNFLRTLGETGLLGVITFYGFVLLILKQTLKAMGTKDALTRTLSIGFVGSIVGLLVSAVSLDVFTASKVAFSFWAVSGLIIKSSQLAEGKSITHTSLFAPVESLRGHFTHHWSLYITLVIAFFLLHQNPFMQFSQLKDIERYTAGIEQLAAARCFMNFGKFEVCRSSGLSSSSHLSLYTVLLIPFLSLFHNPGMFYYLNLSLYVLTCLLTYIFLRKSTSSLHLFVALLLATLCMTVLGITRSPLTNMQFLFLVAGFPFATFLFAKIPSHLRPQSFPLLAKGAFCIALIVITFRLFAHDFKLRFQNGTDIYPVSALQVANSIVVPTGDKHAYLISALNPYYSDIYASGQYTIVPLSLQQPYGSRLSDVWGVPTTPDLHTLYSSLLPSSLLFATDANVVNNSGYQEDFQSLKNAYTLQYRAFGCNETCNIYTVSPNQTPTSTNPLSLFTNVSLNPDKMPSSYRFAVVNGHPYNAAVFAARLTALQKTSFNFMLLTTPTDNAFSPVDVGYVIDGFAHEARYPVFSSPGNDSTVPREHLASDFQTFFTPTAYFISLQTDSSSHIDQTVRLKLYNAFLELEKLPYIKTVFIISNDLNWQDRSDSKNILFAIEKKMQALPNMRTVVITANHDLHLKSTENSYVTNTNQAKTIQYIAGNVFQNSDGEYIDIRVNDADVEIKGITLP